MNRYSLIIVGIVAATVFVFGVARADNYTDIGFRISQYFSNNPSDGVEVVPVAITDQVSPLKLAKNNSVYNVALVDPSDPAATKILIRLNSGVVKALRKFTGSGGGTTIDFPDQSEMALGHCNLSNTSFYAEFSITNPSSVNALFEVVSSSGNGSFPNSFTVNANSTRVQSLGGVVYSGCLVEVPPASVTEGEVTYRVSQNGTVVDTVNYSWTYPQ